MGNMLSDTQKICKLFSIRYPIIQAGMIWASGAHLASASANAGILGLIGAGSMTPELLREQIRKARSLTQGSFGVNIPLLYSRIEEQIQVALDEGVRVFFTSAGSPKKWTPFLKERGAMVVHVCSSPELAQKCEASGVDAVVCEGFEAGGHNGREELTSMVLIPQVKDSVKIPVIAAGGIACGRQMYAAMALGADGVQIGSRFAVSKESSSHAHFKEAVVRAGASDTMLMMKKHIPVRLLKNAFSKKVEKLEQNGASQEELLMLLGKGRAKLGMHNGELDEGELEIGQVAGMIHDILSVQEIVTQIIDEYKIVQNHMASP